MIVLFEKMAMLVILLALGYLCARMKLVGPEFNKGLSKLVMNLFLVGMILSSVINKDMELSGSEALTGFLMLTLMVLICLGIENGRDGIESSEAVFLSTVLSMITIPLLVSVLNL